MKCRQITFGFVEAASGRILPRWSEAHLKTCTRCANYLNEMRRLMILLDEWRVPETIATLRHATSPSAAAGK